MRPDRPILPGAARAAGRAAQRAGLREPSSNVVSLLRPTNARGGKPGSVVEFEVGADGRIVLVKQGAAPKPSRSERIRGTATVKMTTDEIMALLRGDD